MNDYQATYDPADNKLRLRAISRLPKELYERVRAAGFIWAPKQELFVAPMWTPEREDLLLELCGEIGDEDTSLVERAEQRAERFEDYSDKRQADADAAHKTVESICEHIPLGQPILVGHHSERHARKDAERIENGMRKAVKMWETSKYWASRAAGAIRAAKYKERPDVRARRIKTIEADKRKQERALAEAAHVLRFWQGKCTVTNKDTGEKRPFEITEENRDRIFQAIGHDNSLAYSGAVVGKDGQGHYTAYDTLRPVEERYANCPEMTVAEVAEHAIKQAESCASWAQRWIAHYDNRLTYERAMLEADGGLEGNKFEIVPGGRVLLNRRGGEWYIVQKVNRKDGATFSVSVFGYFRTIKVEEITDYQAPKPEEAQKVAEVSKVASLCNYPGERFATITQAEWNEIPAHYRCLRVIDRQGTARHRVRHCLGVYAKLPPPIGEELSPAYCQSNRTHRYWPVFITDAKRKDALKTNAESVGAAVVQMCQEAKAENAWAQIEAPAPKPTDPQKQQIEAMKETLKAGVQVVSTPNLFPTPPDLAKRMVELAFERGWGVQVCAEMNDRCRILEPSAGTGNIVKAIREEGKARSSTLYELVCVEVNQNLVEIIKQHRNVEGGKDFSVLCADFLACNGDLGKFDRILMNPPFDHGSDIQHIKHAISFLNPGGKLVALCANGPRQQEELKPLADQWFDLEPGTFAAEGTNVNTALIVINKTN